MAEGSISNSTELRNSPECSGTYKYSSLWLPNTVAGAKAKGRVSQGSKAKGILSLLRLVLQRPSLSQESGALEKGNTALTPVAVGWVGVIPQSGRSLV